MRGVSEDTLNRNNEEYLRKKKRILKKFMKRTKARNAIVEQEENEKTLSTDKNAEKFGEN